tara:strand:- start:1455 stop:2246 length:792 start_codon:yes stop_codon:yes gene_type:complete
MKLIREKIFTFFERKRYWYFFPKKIRFLIWNIKFLKLYKTKTGFYYLPFFAFKDRIRNKIINNQITDELVYNKIREFIKQDSILLDVGANYGQLSILWSQKELNVSVYAFEASKYIFNILKKNISINSANVQPINSLVGNKSVDKIKIKKTILKENYTYGSNEIFEEEDHNKEGEIINAIKIDDLKFNKDISAMKIDVEGYDLDVLKGAEKTILKHKMPIIFECNNDEKDHYPKIKDFEEFLKKINYKIDSKIDKINYLILPK